MTLSFLTKERFLCLWTGGWFPVSEFWCSTAEGRQDFAIVQITAFRCRL